MTLTPMHPPPAQQSAGVHSTDRKTVHYVSTENRTTVTDDVPRRRYESACVSTDTDMGAKLQNAGTHLETQHRLNGVHMLCGDGIDYAKLLQQRQRRQTKGRLGKHLRLQDLIQRADSSDLGVGAGKLPAHDTRYAGTALRTASIGRTTDGTPPSPPPHVSPNRAGSTTTTGMVTPTTYGIIQARVGEPSQARIDAASCTAYAIRNVNVSLRNGSYWALVFDTCMRERKARTATRWMERAVTH